MFILSAKFGVIPLGGFHQYLAQCERGSQQLIAAVEHLQAKLPDPLGERPIVLEQSK